ncbi:MAG: hypothetical protein K9M97_12315 [Akkermansiaceae bacterium]|nr:hypothetical protein [Akkermansiaceae bacterium]
MKTFQSLILGLVLLPGTLLATPYDNMPQIPGPEKEIADYTPHDIMGCYFGKNKAQPKEHPLRVKEPDAKLKAEWPGAKISSNVDVIIGYILLADSPRSDEAISDVIYSILWRVMDVPKSEIAAAFARVYAEQTEQTARRKVAFLGRYLFPWLADERVLAPLRDMLDDASLYQLRSVGEESPKERISVQNRAYFEIYGYIHNSSLLQLGMPDDQYLMSEADIQATNIEVVDLGTACQRMKAWLDAHWTEVTAKCAEVRAKPDSERHFRGPSAYRILTPLTPEPNR